MATLSAYSEVIRAAMPDATDDDCAWVLWERTPHPMGQVTAQSLFQTACRIRRASVNGVRLCELCDNRVDVGVNCASCMRALRQVAENRARGVERREGAR